MKADNLYIKRRNIAYIRNAGCQVSNGRHSNRILKFCQILLLLFAFSFGIEALGLELEPPETRPFTVIWDNHIRGPYSVHFVNPTSGWAVAGNGVILATSDGGKTWVQQNSGTNDDLMDVHFVDSTTGWVVGYRATILTTADGGKTWIRQEGGTDLPLFSVHFVDATTGWAVGTWGEILTTSDGGKTWRHQHGATEKGWKLFSVHFVDATTGWAAGWGATLTTSDGGKTWQKHRSGTDAEFTKVYFTNATTGWAIGDKDKVIFATSDGGKTWQRQNSGTNGKLVDVHFIDSTTGWAVGRGGMILTTSDGGNTWQQQNTEIDAMLVSVHFVNATTGWVVGNSGEILATFDGGKTWQRQEAWTGPWDLCSVHFVDSTTGWAVGSRGTILTTSDGGKTWIRQESGTDLPLFSVHFVDDNTGWVVGSRATILTTADGGKTWHIQMHSPKTLQQWISAHFINETTGWVVGLDCTIIATSNGGKTWQTLLGPYGQGVWLFSVHFVNATTGWVVGHNGTILATSDGGKTWQQQNSGTNNDLMNDLMDVHFVDSTTGWAVGRGGMILTTSDGGSTWQRQESETGENLKDVYFANAITGWAVGDKGHIFATLDGGETWHRQTNFAVRWGLNSVHIVNATIGWAVGDKGVVLKGTVNHAPYLTSFEVEETIGAVLLEFQAHDNEKDPIEVTKIEYRFAKRGWESLGGPPYSPDKSGFFRISWDPGDPQYRVPVGESIYYRVKLYDKINDIPPQEVNKAFIYSPWWFRLWRDHQPFVIAGALAFGGIFIYFTVLFFLLWFKPVTLTQLGRLPLGEAAGIIIGRSKTASTLEAILNILILPYFLNHQRPRCFWINQYRQGQRAFEDLAPSIRKKFIADENVLDAWVEKRITKISEALERMQSVKQRNLYIPLPVWIGDRPSGELVAEPKPADFRRFFVDTRTVIEIVGPGGIGKSTLAYQLARWAVADKLENRLAAHRMIPVWIEEDTRDLFETVLSTLREMVGDHEIDEDIVESVIRNKRLLVIVDALSERTRETQTHIESVFGGKMLINNLVVTTRRKMDFGPLNVTEINPEVIEGWRLNFFLYQYLIRSGVESEFTESVKQKLAERILHLVEKGGEVLPVTPLLIRLFVDSAITIVRGEGALEDLPDSVPETMLEFLRRVNPQSPDTPNLIENQRMIEAARILGETSLEGDLIPKDFRRERAVERLSEKGFEADELIIDRLVANGVLNETCPAGTQVLRFVFDPLAEYMAALYWVTKLTNNEAEWRSWLNLVKSVQGFPEEILGFIAALYDCVTTYRQTFDIPTSVVSELQDWIK